MMQPTLSKHFQANQPSAIRTAQQLFLKRDDNVDAVNAAIGNVSLPMHPAMQSRMFDLKNEKSPFKDGVVKYTQTKGIDEANDALINILRASGLDVSKLHTQITEGGSAAMELVILGVADAGENILMIDPAYTNYLSMARRTGRKIVTVSRELKENGEFELPDMEKIEKLIEEHKPKAIIIIPYDNPTGQRMSRVSLIKLARLSVKHNLWVVSDEAYRELQYKSDEMSSVWALSDHDVEGIQGRRISIETASKVWNACGLRIGGIISDNEGFVTKSVAENTANLCPNAIGQHIFAALAGESEEDLQKWFDKQRKYYKSMMFDLNDNLKELLPGVIVSDPEASLYSVVDFRNLLEDGSGKNFNSIDFAKWAAAEGSIEVDGKRYTLLFSPMTGFYASESIEKNPGRTQIRLSYVETPERVELVPELLNALFMEYTKK
ncbi:aminotransferase class I/II-fold pyridoxal phosphate-dependent enzyme [Candidatus Dojkabacteria bacterium]|nr:aminotransferase class I/II-fold pyridoxal phosphate-dependent enzyme [Candidatus Dojkabacteria bacterium]